MYKLLFILLFSLFYSFFNCDNSYDISKARNQNNRNNLLVCDEIVLSEVQNIIEELYDNWFNLASLFVNSNIRLILSEKVFISQVYQQDLKHLNPILIDLPPPFRF